MTKLPQLTLSEKGGIIALKKYAKWSYSQLAGRLRRSVPTIKGIVRHYDPKESPDTTINGSANNRWGPGRPPRLNQEARDRLVRAVKRNPAKSSRVLAEGLGCRVSKCAASSKIELQARYVQEEALRQCRKWSLEDGDQRNEGTDWRVIMFTEDAAFKIGEVSDQQHCWREEGNAYDPATLSV